MTLATLWTTPKREREKFSYFPTLLASIPLILGLLLCFLQITPLSDSLLNRLAPHNSTLKRILQPPQGLDVSVEQLDNLNFQELREQLETVDTTSINTDFLSKTLDWDEESSFDVTRAIVLDSAVENELLALDPQSKEQEWGRCISIYPLATSKELPLFWSALLIFFSASILFNTTNSRKFLFQFIAIFGGAYSLLCIITRANPHSIHEGLLKPFFAQLVTDGYGTYYNRNACGGYLVLTLGACIVVVTKEILRSINTVNKERKSRSKEESELRKSNIYEVSKEPLWKTALGDVFDLFNRKLICWLLIMAVIIAAVFASLSRGASIASCAVFTLTSLFLLLFKKEVRRFWYLFAVTLLGVVVVLSTTSTYDKVDDRMSTLVEENAFGETALSSDSRWDNWRAAVDSSKNYFYFGSGLGTYCLSNRSNDVQLKNHRLFYYAENVFVQTLLEMGIVGFVFLITEYVLLFWLLSRFLRGRHSHEAFALSIGTVAVVLGQVITASADFGNYLPANMLLFAILCGVSLGRQNLKKWDDLYALLGKNKAVRAIRKMETLRKIEKVGLVIISLLLVVGLSFSLWMLQENKDNTTRVRLVLEASSLDEDQLTLMSGNALDNLIQEFQDYVSLRDDSAEVRIELSKLYAYKFRLLALQDLKQRQPKQSLEELWLKTSPELLLSSLLKYQSINFKVPIRNIRNNINVVENLKQSAMNKVAARKICPFFVGVNTQLSGILPLTTELSLDDERILTEFYLRRLASFFPYDSYELFNATCRLSYFHLDDLQVRSFNRIVSLTSHFTEPILTILEATHSPKTISNAIEGLLPNDLRMAFEVFLAACRGSKSRSIYRPIEEQMGRILENVQEDNRNAKYFYYVAVFKEHQRLFEEADEAYLKALELSPYNSFYCLSRIKFLIKYRNILDKDEECLRFLQEVRPKLTGRNRWECDNLLEKVVKNASDAKARKAAQERIRREREMDERIRNRGSAKPNEASQDEKPESIQQVDSI